MAARKAKENEPGGSRGAKPEDEDAPKNWKERIFGKVRGGDHRAA